jgi:hypothetical protein
VRRAGRGGGSRVVLRPRRARVVVYLCALALLVTMAWVAVVLPGGEGRQAWGVGSRAGLVLIALAIDYLLYRLGSVRVVATDDGVEVVNVVRRRELAWAQIVGVRLSQDDPWLVLDLDDGDVMQAMGVARSEGAAATDQARIFARMVNDHSRTTRDD